jgi:3-oxoadipate enol-lactonase
MAARLWHDVHGAADAPVLVLGSSLGTLPGMWDAQLEAFARHFRVVRFAHRGHDPVDVPPGPYSLDELGGDVLDLLASLGVRRFSFCGLSLGGMVGMWLAAREPDRVQRLAVCCTSAHLPPAEGWLARAATVRSSGMAAVADPVMGRWFTPGFFAAHAAVVEQLRAAFLALPPEGYAGCCEAIAGMDLRADLPRITAPTLVLAGVEHAETIVAGVAGATLSVVEDAGHLATVEQPAASTAVLLGHLRAGGDT